MGSGYGVRGMVTKKFSREYFYLIFVYRTQQQNLAGMAFGYFGLFVAHGIPVEESGFFPMGHGLYYYVMTHSFFRPRFSHLRACLVLTVPPKKEKRCTLQAESVRLQTQLLLMCCTHQRVRTSGQDRLPASAAWVGEKTWPVPKLSWHAGEMVRGVVPHRQSNSIVVVHTRSWYQA